MSMGWKICVEWRDGSESWLPLKDVKTANPIKLAEYAVANKIDDEPAFNWWVPHVLKKMDRIISLVGQRKARYLKRDQKFGIALPQTAKEALKIDYGVKIKSLTPGKLKSLGLKEGIIITKVNNEAVRSVDQLASKLNETNSGILLEIMSESGKRDYVGFGL